MAGYGSLEPLPDVDVAVLEPSVVAWRLARITSLLDPDWRPGQWDPGTLTIWCDPDDPLVALKWCRVTGCDVVTATGSGLCLRCGVRWKAAGQPDVGVWADEGPGPSQQQRRGRLCQVSAGGRSCPRPATTRLDLCVVHAAHRHRVQAAGGSFDEFLAEATPKPSLGVCAVGVCDEPVHLKTLCTRHYHHWGAAGRPSAAAFADWAARVPPNSDGRTVCLRGLCRLAAAEVLYGLQVRDREQSKISPSGATAYVNLLRDRQVSSVLDIDAAATQRFGRRGWRGAPVIRDRVQLAYAEPETERDNDTWDARVFGHRRATTWCFGGIGQLWLRQATKDWAFVAQTRLSTASLQSRVRSVTQLSAQLARRPGGGHDPRAVGRAEVEAFAVALNRSVARGVITHETRRSTLRAVRCVLEEARAAGLLEGVADTFSLTKDLIPAYVAAEEEPGQALPDSVVAQLSSPAALDALRRSVLKQPGVMGEHAGDQAVMLFETLRDTGRRPSEVTSLTVDAVDRDHDGSPVLVYDNRKSRRHGRRLPISEELHAKLVAWRHVVLDRFPATPPDRLSLFPRPTRNRDGTEPLRSDQLGHKFTEWVAALDPVVTGPDPGSEGQLAAFPAERIYPYAFRHTYAQCHADAGTPVEVLQALMDHTDIKTTQCYYRITSKRKREATDRLSRMRRTASGEPRAWSGGSPAALVRDAVAQIAVPFGLCSEPANVRAAGQQCPIRYRCMGCAYFSTDPSFLPELNAHLDDLLRARERGQAIGADDWALVPLEEIDRLRALTRSLQADLAALPDDDRQVIQRASEDVRAGRRSVAVTIGRRTP